MDKTALEFNPLSFTHFFTKIILSAFLLFIIVLSFVFYLNYSAAKNRIITSIDSAFSERVRTLDSAVFSTVKHVKVIKSIVNRYLDEWNEEKIAERYVADLTSSVTYHQEKDYYTLQEQRYIGPHKVAGTILGVGHYESVNRDQLKWIHLGLELCAVQEAEHENNPDITLSYYVSQKDGFLAVYPSIRPEILLNQAKQSARQWLDYVFEVYNDFAPEIKNPQRDFFWTKPYLDRAGNGMMVTYAVPVDVDNKLVGVLGTDIVLTFLDRFTTPLQDIPGQMILVSGSREILSASGLSYRKESDIIRLKDMVDLGKNPAALPHSGVQKMAGQVLFVRKLSNAPWKVVYIVSNQSIHQKILFDLVRYLVILFLVTALFGFGYFFVLRKFIRPGVTALSERMKAEQALIANEKRYREMVESAGNSFHFYSLDLDGSFLYVGPSALDWFGISEQDLIGRNWSTITIWSNKSRQAGIAAFQQCVKGIIPSPVELDFQLQGEQQYLITYPRPVKNEHGRVIRVDGFTVNLTERLKLEEALRNAAEKAKTASQAKSTFLANMSHELRTPLNVILGFSRLLERDPAVTPHQLEYLKPIHNSGDHLLALINNVLDISKIENGNMVVQPEDFDLSCFLKDFGRLFQTCTAEKNILYTLEAARDLPRLIRTDKRKLRQILINLISNAIHHTSRGSVTLRITRTDSVAAESSTGRQQQNLDLWLRFEVKDTGSGIDARDIHTIFQPFTQAQDNTIDSGGTGLGLSISRNFVALMGGDLQVASTIGCGSTFRFNLPVHEVSTLYQTIKKAGNHQPVSLLSDEHEYRILLAEDDKDSRLMVTRLLQAVGFNVHAVADGKQAVEHFLPYHPDLILMDINMPVMDGLTATGKIKGSEAGAAIPVIALTAHVFEKERQKILDAGCDDCIIKPFDETKLFAALAHHLGVQYRYSDDTVNQHVGMAEKPKSAALTGLPEQLIRELKAAAGELNFQRTRACIEQIRLKDKDLADALMVPAEAFRFEEIVQWIEKSKVVT